MTDGWLGGRVGELCAVLSPPVALALAALFDEQAAVAESNDAHDGFDLALADGAFAATLAVARAILREDA
jgi:hypothetical protein